MNRVQKDQGNSTQNSTMRKLEPKPVIYDAKSTNLTNNNHLIDKRKKLAGKQITIDIRNKSSGKDTTLPTSNNPSYNNRKENLATMHQTQMTTAFVKEIWTVFALTDFNNGLIDVMDKQSSIDNIPFCNKLHRINKDNQFELKGLKQLSNKSSTLGVPMTTRRVPNTTISESNHDIVNLKLFEKFQREKHKILINTQLDHLDTIVTNPSPTFGNDKKQKNYTSENFTVINGKVFSFRDTSNKTSSIKSDNSSPVIQKQLNKSRKLIRVISFCFNMIHKRKVRDVHNQTLFLNKKLKKSDRSINPSPTSKPHIGSNINKNLAKDTKVANPPGVPITSNQPVYGQMNSIRQQHDMARKLKEQVESSVIAPVVQRKEDMLKSLNNQSLVSKHRHMIHKSADNNRTESRNDPYELLKVFEKRKELQRQLQQIASNVKYKDNKGKNVPMKTTNLNKQDKNKSTHKKLSNQLINNLNSKSKKMQSNTEMNTKRTNQYAKSPIKEPLKNNLVKKVAIDDSLMFETQSINLEQYEGLLKDDNNLNMGNTRNNDMTTDGYKFTWGNEDIKHNLSKALGNDIRTSQGLNKFRKSQDKKAQWY